MHPTVGEACKYRYVIEFLGLPEPHCESDLKRGLVQHMKAFVLELGRDFLFVGEESRLQVRQRLIWVPFMQSSEAERAIQEAKQKHNGFLKELELKPLP